MTQFKNQWTAAESRHKQRTHKTFKYKLIDMFPYLHKSNASINLQNF